MNCRLLYLVGQLRPGGSERQLYLLLERMDRKRYRPHVIVWNDSETVGYAPQIQALGVPVYSLSSPRSKVAKLTEFSRIVRQLTPEVVHSYSQYTNFGAWLATLGTKTITIGTVRSDFALAKKEAGRWLGRLSARWPRSQIFNSIAAAEQARFSRSIFAPRQLWVVRNALDLERFRMTPLSRNGRVCILGIGSLLQVKRWDRLIKVASVLKQNGFNFFVRLAGDGPLLSLLKKQTRALGVASCVEFVGHTDNIPALLADATFLAHTSDSEGLPNAVMEAMACGRAVVATNVGDIPYIVENEITGFVVPRENDAMLVDRMAKLIANRDLCDCMGRAARAKAEHEFELDRLVRETFAAYRAAGWKGN